MSPSLPDDTINLARTLAEAFRGQGEELYLVGGAVRDALIGRVDLDLDFATSARPPRTTAILESLSLGKPYGVGEKFGTIAMALPDRIVEITTYRSEEHYPAGSRKPEVVFGTTLSEDLSRRDFTVNAIAMDPLTLDLVDPLGGRDDLEAGIIRAVGDPAARFAEDPLRLLRAVRFASRLRFVIEPATWEAMKANAGGLGSISRERIRDEYSRSLVEPEAVRGLEMLRESGLMARSVPELLELTRMRDHGPRHPLSLWDHTMRVVAGTPERLVVRWAALLHDIAKPVTRTHEPDGRPRFFHHEEVGAKIARRVLTGLRYSNQIVGDVGLLIETHMQLHSYSSEWSDGAVRRLMLRLGPLLDDAIALACADGAGHSLTGESANAPKLEHLQDRVADLRSEPVERLKSPLTGDDLMERYQRPPGPWIREVKQALDEEVIEGRLRPDDTARAWELADRLVGTDA